MHMHTYMYANAPPQKKMHMHTAAGRHDVVRRLLALKFDQRELEKLWGSYVADGLQGIGSCGLLAAQLSGAGPGP